MNEKPPRYAHENGQVGLCFDRDGEHMITCGSEGDVRIFAGFEDDDPITHKIGDTVYTVAYYDEKLYTATDDNAVKVYTFREGQADGLLTRFTAPVTTLCFSSDASFVVAGSSDFTVKRVNIEDKTQKVLIEHEAPVLHVTIHPQDSLVASSSCDGTLQIYNFEEEKVVKTISVFNKSNDVTTSKTLARTCWDKTGEILFVPKNKEIVAFNSSTWESKFTLAHTSINELVSIVCLSPCGKYLAVSTRDGIILIFDIKSKQCLHKSQHPNKIPLSGLAWNPKGNQMLAWVDIQGQLGVFENVISSQEPQTTNASVSNASDEALNAEQLEDLFDDVDDDMLIQASAAPVSSEKSDAKETGNDVTMTTQIGAESDSDDDGPLTINKSKITRIQDDDDISMDTDSVKPSTIDKIMDANDDDDADDAGSTVSGAPAPAPPPMTVVQGFEPTPLQRAFQPASTPTHCAHRFMKWNSVGVILQYSTDDENSINIEFHDSATHHALHVVNTMGHTMADLSSEAVLLACEADEDEEDTSSKLVCMHFASWDNTKEWGTSMPKGEEIRAITLGEGWCAVATDKRIVRIFSIGGIQRDIISIPGPIVALAGYMHQLLIVYHKGMALPGDQCMGVKLLHVTGKKKTVISGEDLPLTHKASLAWIGFSAEGTPFSADSVGIVRMLNRGFGNNWIQVANLRKNIKGKSDNYWIVGIHENPQQIRAILCKGARFPQTLPRPNVNVLQFELPLCEMSTDKGTMEENIMRSTVMSQHFDWWSSQGFDYDEISKNRAVMPQQEALMKLFALACKTDREYRAVEICEMMPSSHTVQLAIKYAGRLRLIQLADRLGEVARQKAEEEMAKTMQTYAESDEDEEKQVAQSRPWEQRNGHVSEPPAQAAEESGEDEVDDAEDDAPDEDEEGDIVEQIEAEEKRKVAPKLKVKETAVDTTPVAPTMSQKAKKNPFKVGSQKTPSSTGKGTSVFDSMEKPKNKPSRSPFESLQKKTKVLKKPRNKGQGKLFSKSAEENAEKPASDPKPSKTGFELWFAANETNLQEEYPDLSTTDLTIEAAKAFKQLSTEEKKEWNDKATSASPEESEDSRKKKKVPTATLR